jgi:hypothetical protein
MTFFCDTAPNPGLPHIMVQPRESVQDEVREAFWGAPRAGLRADASPSQAVAPIANSHFVGLAIKQLNAASVTSKAIGAYGGRSLPRWRP